MHLNFLRLSACLAALPLLALLACTKEDVAAPVVVTTGSMAIELEHILENAQDTTGLALDTRTYTTANGQDFVVSKLKYLLSNLRLKRADGSTFAVPESYYLVNAADANSSHIIIKGIPYGQYTGMSFILGVDSLRNHAGAQTGALRSDNDLYWDWNQGYIFFKLEGHSPQPNAQPAIPLVFHLGGSDTPNNVHTISPSFNGDKLDVRSGHTPEVHMAVNLQSLFDGPNVINFATTNTIMSPSGATPMINNAAAGMFRVEHVHPN